MVKKNHSIRFIDCITKYITTLLNKLNVMLNRIDESIVSFRSQSITFFNRLNHLKFEGVWVSVWDALDKQLSKMQRSHIGKRPSSLTLYFLGFESILHNHCKTIPSTVIVRPTTIEKIRNSIFSGNSSLQAKIFFLVLPVIFALIQTTLIKDDVFWTRTKSRTWMTRSIEILGLPGLPYRTATYEH